MNPKPLFTAIAFLVFSATLITQAQTNSTNVPEWKVLLDESYELLMQGNSEQADVNVKKALSIAKEDLDPDGLETADFYLHISRILKAKGLREVAEDALKNALVICELSGSRGERIKGELQKEFGDIYSEQALYPEAEQAYKQALAISKKLYGEEHQNTGKLLSRLAMSYANLCQFNEAESLLKHALSILEKSLGENHHEVGTTLSDLGYLYTGQARYLEAEQAYNRANSIFRNVYGENHPATAETLNGLGNIYIIQSRFSEAENALNKSLIITEKTLGKNSPDVARNLNSLAMIYVFLGRYGEVEPLLEQSLSIYEKNYGPDHPSLYEPLNTLGMLYLNQGRNVEAEQVLERASSILEAVFGPDDVSLCTVRSALAVSRANQGRDSEAANLFLKNYTVLKNSLGADHPLTLGVQGLLAISYLNQDFYSKAEPILRQTLSGMEKTLGEDNALLSVSITRLAEVLLAQEKHTQAEPLLLRALKLSGEGLGQHSASTKSTLTSLSQLYFDTQQPTKALEYAERAFKTDSAVRSESFSMLSEKQRMDFVEHQGNLPLCIAASIALQNGEASAEASRISWKMLLRSKAAVLDATLEDHQNLSGNPEAEALFSQLGETKTRLSNLQTKDPSLIDEAGSALYRDQMDSLQETREDLEQQLARLSGRFREGRRASKVTAEAVESALPENSTLIEFFHFTPLVPETLTNNLPEPSPQYIAFVLTDRTQPPQLISIGDSDSIDTLIDRCRIKMRQGRSVKSDLQKLYQMVWAPIQTAVGDKSRLLISPDGALNQLPFAALRDSNGNYLIEQHDIGYLACGRDLIRQIDEEQSKPPALFGDPEFDHLSSNTNSVKKTLSRSVFRSIPTDRARAMYRDLQFPSLPATRDEVVQISTMLFGQAPSVFLGSSATEENLKKLLRPQLLHLATHGFYLSESDAQEDSNPWKNPMLRSGLALSGASASLTQTTPPAGEDGIVTAEEVGSLDLWGTQIVVLSACDTGRGKSISGEGVLGLRRAFVQAGTKNLMLTLWQVEDTFTKNLMLDFYRDYLKTHDAVGSLSRIQRNRLSDDPRFWAPFLISVQGKGGL